MSSIITASEARKRALDSQSFKDDEMIKDFFQQVEINCDIGSTDFKFQTEGKHFTDTQEEYLEGLGYKLSWNSHCLWYEVRF